MPNHAAERLRVRPKVRLSLVELTRRPTSPQRAVLRAQVILAAANGLSNTEIARRTGIARQNVIEIRRRFQKHGMASVLADAARPGRPKMISAKTVATITETVMKAPPKNATHWSSRDLAERFGVGRTTVQTILRSHNLQPHRVKSFKFSNDPKLSKSCVMSLGFT